MSDRINDFAFKIATANGTGSASANGLIMQTIFRMGIPVTGKNLFPSNIQGLPTWYEIRVNKNGYTARTPVFDLMLALNAATYAKDVAEVRTGGWLVYDSTWPLDSSLIRDDVTYIGVPLAQLCNDNFKGVRNIPKSQHWWIPTRRQSTWDMTTLRRIMIVPCPFGFGRWTKRRIAS